MSTIFWQNNVSTKCQFFKHRKLAKRTSVLTKYLPRAALQIPKIQDQHNPDRSQSSNIMQSRRSCIKPQFEPFDECCGHLSLGYSQAPPLSFNILVSFSLCTNQTGTFRSITGWKTHFLLICNPMSQIVWMMLCLPVPYQKEFRLKLSSGLQINLGVLVILCFDSTDRSEQWHSCHFPTRSTL